MSWPEVRARYLFREVNERGGDLPLASVTKDGGVELRSDLRISVWNPGDDISSYKRVLPGDFVIGLRSFQSGIGSSSLAGLVSPAYTVLRPVGPVVTGYYRHLFKSSVFISRLENIAQGIRQGRTISTEDFYNMRVMVPSEREQRVIAHYLDAETARIDALIEKKRRMMELLQTRLSARLDRLLRESGTAPEPLKRFVTKVGSGSTPRGGSDVYVPEGIAFLRSQNVRDGRIVLDDVVYITEDDDASLNPTRLKENDVLLNITGGSIGRTAITTFTDLPANVSQHVCIVRPATGIDPLLLQAALDSPAVQDQIALVQVGGNREGLNFEQVRELTVTLPRGPQSTRIRDELVESRNLTEVLRGSLLRQVSLLVEHRQALITAMVSGKTDLLLSA